MTLDPTVEARVRAKRAAPLEQDADALALLDEVERLRGVLEHLTLLHGAERVRAEKAEADYRRLLSERAEANQLAGRCAHQRDVALDEVERLRGVLEHLTLLHGAERVRAEKAEAERDAAIEGRAEVFFAAEDRERLRAWEDAARVAWSICVETAPDDCPGPDAVRAAVDRLDDDAIRFEGECVVQRARAEKAESRLAEQTARAERAEAEAEVLLWNLGGCEVYALGNSLDQEPAAERARPALLAVLDLARRYRDRREDYEHACELVARMHAAAVGEVCGPIKGVIEDVAALRAERDAALAANAELRAALEEWHDPGHAMHPATCRTCATLSRPDLGAGAEIARLRAVEDAQEAAMKEGK